MLNFPFSSSRPSSCSIRVSADKAFPFSSAFPFNIVPEGIVTPPVSFSRNDIWMNFPVRLIPPSLAMLSSIWCSTPSASRRKLPGMPIEQVVRRSSSRLPSIPSRNCIGAEGSAFVTSCGRSGTAFIRSALPMSAIRRALSFPSLFCSVTLQSAVALNSSDEFAVFICRDGTWMAWLSALSSPCVDTI